MTAVEALRYLSDSASNAFRGVKIQGIDSTVHRLWTTAPDPVIVLGIEESSGQARLTDDEFLAQYGAFEFREIRAGD